MNVKLGEFAGMSASTRPDGRKNDELRPVTITRNVVVHAEGSAMIEIGQTRVLCTATVEHRVPPFLKGQGTGWVTAEYGMLPRSSDTRIPREAAIGKVKGRTQEIQRLIGRSLRSITDLACLGERQMILDCDVLQADGGTRTAAITGAWVAMADAVRWLQGGGHTKKDPILDQVAAISVGIVDGRIALDLCYEEDSSAEVDMNVVMTKSGRFVEIQGTAETNPFTEEQFQEMVAMARKGVKELLDVQERSLENDEKT